MTLPEKISVRTSLRSAYNTPLLIDRVSLTQSERTVATRALLDTFLGLAGLVTPNFHPAFRFDEY